MATALYRVARMSGDRLEVLGEFHDKADAIDMADRAKYMLPFVVRTMENGEIELLPVSATVQNKHDSIASLIEASNWSS